MGSKDAPASRPRALTASSLTARTCMCARRQGRGKPLSAHLWAKAVEDEALHVEPWQDARELCGLRHASAVCEVQAPARARVRAQGARVPCRGMMKQACTCPGSLVHVHTLQGRLTPHSAHLRDGASAAMCESEAWVRRDACGRESCRSRGHAARTCERHRAPPAVVHALPAVVHTWVARPGPCVGAPTPPRDTSRGGFITPHTSRGARPHLLEACVAQPVAATKPQGLQGRQAGLSALPGAAARSGLRQRRSLRIAKAPAAKAQLEPLEPAGVQQWVGMCSSSRTACTGKQWVTGATLDTRVCTLQPSMPSKKKK